MKSRVIISVAVILFMTVSYLFIYTYGENRQLKNEIAKFHSEEEVKTEMNGFIKEMSEGKSEGFEKYLIGEAKKNFLSIKERKQEDLKVKQTDIQELRAIAKNSEKTKITSYATYRTTYDVGTDDVQSIYIQAISVKAEWIKTDNGWKCEHYEIHL
ncbi:hypothetical protein [Bacillus thuringiensis]|uniref:hypothetical protein n=1 Tax=Bacillus thuringiensis TaxID=1428 RepID=UPI002FBEC9EC